MSVEYLVTGIINLDAAAASYIRGRPLWHWFQDDHPAVGPLQLDFPERWYRNIGMHLTVDLAEAQQMGTVTGDVAIYTQDGTQTCEIASYTNNECWQGEEECFNEPIILRPSTPLKIAIPASMHLAGFDDIQILLQDADTKKFLIIEKPSPLVCACGGWDARKDKEVCGKTNFADITKIRVKKSLK